MKSRILLVPERESLSTVPIQYTIVCPPPSFVRTEVMTVFPELKALCAADKKAAEAAAAEGGPLSPFADMIGAANLSSSASSVSSAGGAAHSASCSPLPEGASLTSIISTPTSSASSLPPFTNIAGMPNKSIFVMTTFQPCDCDNLTAFTEGSADFKDWSRERFLDLMGLVEKRLGVTRDEGFRSHVHREQWGESGTSSFTTPTDDAHIPKPTSRWWIDYPDPATGVPIHSHATSTCFCESDAIELLLKMELMYVNGCRMVVHPKFKENVYPCSAIIYGGSAEELKALLEGI